MRETAGKHIIYIVRSIPRFVVRQIKALRLHSATVVWNGLQGQTRSSISLNRKQSSIGSGVIDAGFDVDYYVVR